MRFYGLFSYIQIYIKIHNVYNRSYLVGTLLPPTPRRGRGEFFPEFLTNKKAQRSLFSLVKIYEKKSQNNSPLHLPLTLHLKTPTQGVPTIIYVYIQL